MGMFDYLIVEMPLPDGFDPGREEFQTKDTPDQWCMRYTLGADRRLRDEARVDVNYEGELNFYASNVCMGAPDRNGVYSCATSDDLPGWVADYTARFVNGFCVEITGKCEPYTDRPLLPREELWAQSREWAERNKGGGTG